MQLILQRLIATRGIYVYKVLLDDKEVDYNPVLVISDEDPFGCLWIKTATLSPCGFRKKL